MYTLHEDTLKYWNTIKPFSFVTLEFASSLAADKCVLANRKLFVDGSEILVGKALMTSAFVAEEIDEAEEEEKRESAICEGSSETKSNKS